MIFFITEAVLVTLMAGLMALVLVHFSMPLFSQLTGKVLSMWRFGILNSLGFILIFSVITGMVSGIYPSLILARFQTIPALRGKMTNMGGTVYFRKSLLVLQFVITVFMISASFIIYEQLQFVNQADLGFPQRPGSDFSYRQSQSSFTDTCYQIPSVAKPIDRTCGDSRQSRGEQ